MSLYYETSTLLTMPNGHTGSLKSRIFNHPAGKSSPGQIYALITEVSKWSSLLKEAIDKADILALEPKLTPILSLLLVHDLLLSRKGIAAPEKHVLRGAVERHRARLKAEFAKIRLRHKCATVEELRQKVEDERRRDGSGTEQPRWSRVNTVSTSLKEQLDTTFKGYMTGSLREVRIATAKEKILHIDEHVPDLLALPPRVELTRTQAYNKGEIVLQDKASCLPAHLLLGSMQDEFPVGDIIDACAAPGNKTTHLAALLSPLSSHTLAATITSHPTIYAVERDLKRSNTLKDTVSRTNTSNAIAILPGQDFLALDLNETRFANVTAILLDPSCSGSGIIGREDIPVLSLPSDPRQPNLSSNKTSNHPAKSKKRKRPSADVPKEFSNSLSTTPSSGPREVDTEAEAVPEPAPNPSRLLSLSNLQTRLLTHAFSFPAATHITYSTCSLHHMENENVAARALASKVAKERGWRVLKREEQVEALRNWRFRGVKKPSSGAKGEMELDEVERKACLRCWPDGHADTGVTDGDGKGEVNGGTEGTMGFFVVGFVRDGKVAVGLNCSGDGDTSSRWTDDGEEWDGFVD